MVSFWVHFGVILVSFWCPWGSFGDPGRPRGPPKGAESKKRRKTDFADPPPGHRADIFFVFGCRVADRCADRRSDGQNVLHKRSPRLPQTMKPKVLHTRNRCFHISTRISTMTENGLQGVSFGDPGRPRGPPKGAEAKKRRKREFANPPRDPFWGPLGDLGRHRADIFFVFGCRVGDLRDDRRFDGQTVLYKRSPRPSQTMKPMVSPTRNNRFHFSTCTSKIAENGLQWVLL